MISNKDTKFLKAFGNNLRRIRESKEMSQEAVSLKMGTTPSQVGRIERGEINPTVSTLKVLADALGLQIADLFQYDYS
jgi:transcriptional regulator with XRE-family HTH domain